MICTLSQLKFSDTLSLLQLSLLNDFKFFSNYKFASKGLYPQLLLLLSYQLMRGKKLLLLKKDIHLPI